MTETIRYGYVDYHTPDRPTRDCVAGRWRFRLADDAPDFATAWENAVRDFRVAHDPWRDAKVAGHTFNYGDLIGYPDILARHGLTFLPDDETAPILLVDHDDVLVDPEDDEERCLYEEDGELCGAWLGDNEGWDGKCGTHADRAEADSDD